ncbi:MAG TPA: hypothetical protein VL418_13890 [Devosiaceae bacterium]|jgi:hypothetical protein|nr:hypothetical protein [Devosiaceae bacterium]
MTTISSSATSFYDLVGSGTSTTTDTPSDDILTALAANYTAVGQAASTATTPTNYVPVDPNTYLGTWTGQNSDGSSVRVAITSVSGFKATVRLQTGSTVTQQQVLISNSSFHIGDSKFMVTSEGSATVMTAVTDPLTGNVSVEQANLTQLGSSADPTSAAATAAASSLDMLA